MAVLEFGKYGTERVRTALALDELEGLAKGCGRYVSKHAGDGDSFCKGFRFGFMDDIEDIARNYSVSAAILKPDAMEMLRREIQNGIADATGGPFEVRKVGPCFIDGELFSIEITFFDNSMFTHKTEVA